jgi:hypothetical protein
MKFVEQERENRRHRRLREAAAKQPKALEDKAETKPEQPAPGLTQVDGPGKPAQEKTRLTWLPRQVIHHYFDPARTPVGQALDSILIVKCGSHCRLENISEDGTWLTSEEFVLDGKHVKREAGSKVHPGLMAPWRKLRKDMPRLFDKGVRVWGQPVAYMDSIICLWHSALIGKEVKQAIHQVDMFSGELTQEVRESNFFLHQIKHVIGAKQTAKLQLTDTTVSFPCKAAAQKKKAVLRRRLLEKSKAEGVPERLEAGPAEVMELAVAMQAEAIAIAERGEYVKAMRSACFFVYQPVEGGLAPCPGEWATHSPLAGHRIGTELSENRLQWLGPDRKPLPCDWSRLKRNKPAKLAVEDCIAMTLDAVAGTTMEIEQDRETLLAEGESMQVQLAVKPGEEEALMPEEACWLELPPKVRRQRMMEAVLGTTTSQLESKTGRKAKKKAMF